MTEVLVHIEEPSVRAGYAVQQVLGRLLGWQVRYTGHPERDADKGRPVLVYGRRKHQGCFHVAPAGTLRDGAPPGGDPPAGVCEGLPVLFPTEGAHLPFDPFAAAFHMLSRVEEYDNLPRDAHGRPVAEAMLAVRRCFAERPVVDEWALMLAQAWQRIASGLPDPVRAYTHTISVDLDNGFKYLGRPWWRTLGSVARDVLQGAWAELPLRIAVLCGRHPDPYDVYEGLRAPFTANAGRTIFFVLAAPRGPYDHAVPVEHPLYRERLIGLTHWAEVGVHPAYASGDPGAVMAGQARWARTLGKEVRASRQHFLRFRLPDTFRSIASCGIREEHSMGFHDRIGFRAGTCTPYDWYDLPAERATTLTIHPFAVMDSALRYRMGLSPSEATARVAPLIGAVRKVRGHFTGVWHESLLATAGSAGWREAILRIIEHARP
jgi:hypothetical protein